MEPDGFRTWTRGSWIGVLGRVALAALLAGGVTLAAMAGPALADDPPGASTVGPLSSGVVTHAPFRVVRGVRFVGGVPVVVQRIVPMFPRVAAFPRFVPAFPNAFLFQDCFLREFEVDRFTGEVEVELEIRPVCVPFFLQNVVPVFPGFFDVEIKEGEVKIEVHPAFFGFDFEVEREFDFDFDFEEEFDRDVDFEKEFPRRVEVDRDFPRRVEVEKDVPRNVEVERDFPRRVEVEKDIPRNVEVERDVPRNVKVERDVPRNVEVERDVRRNVKVERDVPRNVKDKD